MLELNDLQYQPATTEQPVLKGINLRDSSGRLVLTGASGSGKTSLIEVISGIAGAQRGTVTWKGQSLTRWQRR